MELIKSDQIILRSIYEVIRKEVVSHGYLPDSEFYTDSLADVRRWQADVAAIKNLKGFHIDLFSESSARYKGMKDSVRIVMFLSRVYDGEIGAPVNTIMEQDIEGASKYRLGFLPGKASNLIFAIHLLSSTSEQSFTLNAIISNTLGNRTFLPFYDKPTDQPFLVLQSSFGDLDNPIENFMEKVYYYTVPDVYLGDIKLDREIQAIKEIKVDEIHKGDTLATIEAK